MSHTPGNCLSCLNCTFSPFCLTTENCQQTKSTNLAVKQYRTLKRKERLCVSQNKFLNLYAVQRGALKACQTASDGKEIIREFYFTGEVLGYEAIYSGNYPYTAIALTETIICEIPYNKFLELLHSKPELQEHILYLMSRQLTIGNYLTFTTAEQRLAAFLIDLSCRLCRAKQQVEFSIPLSNQNIGDYLRLTAETISRIFSRLQKNKIIVLNRKKIHILQPELLKNIAEGLLAA